MKVTVSVTSDLVTNQRVHKVCNSLIQNGYEVKLVGRRLHRSKPVKREYRTVRMNLLFRRSFLFYLEYNISLFFYLLFDKSDILLSNDTDTLLANYLVSVIKKKPLVFDANEIFPETPEVTDRTLAKKFWTLIEDYIFPRLHSSYTVCESIASYYNEKYKMNMQVVRNTPAKKTTPVNTVSKESPIDSKGKKVIIYQGNVCAGRGLEWMIEAMTHLDNFIFYIIGDGDKTKELKVQAKKLHLNDKVFFLGKIPFEEISEYTVKADIGVNLLENWGLSYYYSLPNRIFDYIREGVPIISSDFPEVHKIITQYKVGMLVHNFDPLHIASTIKKMVQIGKNKFSFAKANADLCWENEEPVLLKVIRNAV